MVRLLGPFRPVVEFDSDEITDFPEVAVANSADELLFRGIPPQFDAKRNGRFELKARAGGRNILEKRGRRSSPARMLDPAHLDHVGAQHARFVSALFHA